MIILHFVRQSRPLLFGRCLALPCISPTRFFSTWSRGYCFRLSGHMQQVRLGFRAPKPLLLACWIPLGRFHLPGPTSAIYISIDGYGYGYGSG